jgi:hypothetical protein
MWRPRPRSFSGPRLARLWCADPFGQGLVESGGAAVEIDPGDVTVGSDQNSVWVGYLADYRYVPWAGAAGVDHG